MPMDITQMNYLINIVECGCNLSLAAKKIHISQSALSQFVTNFENDEEVLLFNRRNGRLDGLTESGERIFRYAQEIVTKADNPYRLAIAYFACLLFELFPNLPN